MAMDECTEDLPTALRPPGLVAGGGSAPLRIRTPERRRATRGAAAADRCARVHTGPSTLRRPGPVRAARTRNGLLGVHGGVHASFAADLGRGRTRHDGTAEAAPWMLPRVPRLRAVGERCRAKAAAVASGA
eukprot:356910-Chlamydomonas_euryale.AAC.3